MYIKGNESDSLMEKSIQELFDLRIGDLLTIEKVEWWLSKYEDYYKYCYSNRRYHMSYDKLFPLCTCSDCLNKPENDYCWFYGRLECIAQFHSLEKYCKIELLLYDRYKESKEALRNWVIRNEKIGSKELACFIIDYLDYSEFESEIEHLMVSPFLNNDLVFYIERFGFKNLIEFKNVFDKLYYIDQLYPEGLARIEEEMNNLSRNQ